MKKGSPQRSLAWMWFFRVAVWDAKVVFAGSEAGSPRVAFVESAERGSFSAGLLADPLLHERSPVVARKEEESGKLRPPRV